MYFAAREKMKQLGATITDDNSLPAPHSEVSLIEFVEKLVVGRVYLIARNNKVYIGDEVYVVKYYFFVDTIFAVCVSDDNDVDVKVFRVGCEHIEVDYIQDKKDPKHLTLKCKSCGYAQEMFNNNFILD